MVKAAAKKSKPEKAPVKKAKPTVQQKAKLLDGKLSDLSRQKNSFAMSVLSWESAHAHAGELKKTMEKQQVQLNQLVQDVIDIRNGNYNPPLPFKGEQGQAAKGKKTVPGTETNPQVLGDDAQTMPLSALKEFGMTDAKLEAVSSAAEGNTIGALEKFMRSDRDWMRKCKGLGGEWCDKLSDALAAFRKQHPMPEPVLTASEKEAKPAEKQEAPAVTTA